MKVKGKNLNDIELITSWDDFRNEDERLVGLLSKYKMPGIFYIPYQEVIDPEKTKLAKTIKEFFEIGSHTVNHRILTKIPRAAMYAEIVDSKAMLEELLDIKIKSFCYPRGRYNDEVIEVLKEAGYENARTVDVGCTVTPEDPFRTFTTAHVFSGRTEYGDKTWLEYALDKFDEVWHNGGYYHLWGHSWEIEKHKEWDNLEKLFIYINDKITPSESE